MRDDLPTVCVDESLLVADDVVDVDGIDAERAVFVEQRGVFAQIRDSEGNRVGLFSRA